jgi:hypothetical protein
MKARLYPVVKHTARFIVFSMVGTVLSVAVAIALSMQRNGFDLNYALERCHWHLGFVFLSILFSFGLTFALGCREVWQARNMG